VTNRPAVTSAGAAANARYGVGLAQAAEKVSEMIALSARNGVSQARISLAPATLGTINIHLQRTPDGIIARVVTEHPEAAATLASGGEDLRRQLAQQGTQLLRLDIETSDRRASQGDADPNGGSSARERPTGAEAPVPAVSTETELSPLSCGSLTASSLINVLA
jgi:flagellar hook-length control protein FliK